MLRSFSALLAPIVGLMMVGGAASEASEVSAVSEVTTLPSRSAQPQMLTAHAIENAPSPPSEVTIAPGASASPTRITADNDRFPGEGTVSEVTILPAPVAPRAITSLATRKAQSDGGGTPARISPPKTSAR